MELLGLCENVLFLICGFDQADMNIVSICYVSDRIVFIILSLSLPFSFPLSLLSYLDSTPCVLYSHPSWYIGEEQCPFCSRSEVWKICQVRLWQCQEQDALWNSKSVIHSRYFLHTVLDRVVVFITGTM